MLDTKYLKAASTIKQQRIQKYFDCRLLVYRSEHRCRVCNSPPITKMIDDQDLGFFANFLGIFIFVLVIAYHYVMADPKYEGN
ncbi:hypothetical protein Pfo_025148 [Paulownia fortunei]|nr:hypothetical protein Pfo_025148 [Paulownia fortunei]